MLGILSLTQQNASPIFESTWTDTNCGLRYGEDQRDWNIIATRSEGIEALVIAMDSNFFPQVQAFVTFLKMLIRYILVVASCWLAGASPIFSNEGSTHQERRFESRDALHQETHPHHELRPRYHPDHDAADHIHLMPRSEKPLFWAQHRSQSM